MDGNPSQGISFPPFLSLFHLRQRLHQIDPQILIAWLPALQNHVTSLSAALPPTADPASPESLTLAHLAHLTSFVASEHAATIDEVNALLAHDEITFALLWAILLPRTVLYTRCAVTGAPRAVRLVHAEQCSRGQATFWRVDAEYVEYNVEAFAERDGGGSAELAVAPPFGLANLASLEIPSFKGAAKITSLPVYPVKWYRGWESLRSRLVERGRKWVGLQGVHHRHYNATGYHYKDMKFVKLNVCP